jgi:hypothetical protein
LKTSTISTIMTGLHAFGLFKNSLWQLSLESVGFSKYWAVFGKNKLENFRYNGTGPILHMDES